MLQRRRLQVIGFGFLWIALWAVFGSLLGFQIQDSLMTGDMGWLSSLNRDIFRSAHAHMNSLGILTIALGLCLPVLRHGASESTLGRLCLTYVTSVVMFGIGLLLEGFVPTQEGSLSPAALIAAAGGSLLILCMISFGVIALKGVRHP